MTINQFHHTIAASLILAISVLAACSEDNEPQITPDERAESRQSAMFVMTDLNTNSGVLLPFDSLPEGTMNPAEATNGRQIANARPGGTYYKNFIFQRNSSAGESGIQKYVLEESGTLTEAGFIAGASNYGGCNSVIVDDTRGYYYDRDLGAAKVQTFNPTAMQRTGEIDLTAAITLSDTLLEKTGERMLAVRDGKLYADIQYAVEENFGGNSRFDSVFVAVIDIASGEYEKTIVYPEAQEIGYYTDNINSYQIADNGDIYLMTMGNMLSAERNGKILRIPAGATDFDPNFEISINDYTDGSGIRWFHGGTAVLGNKLFTYIMDAAFDSEYSNFNSEDKYFYEIDLTTQEAMRIDKVPVTDFTSINTPFVRDNLVYIPYSNSSSSGYYLYNGTSYESLVELTSGVVQGLVSLDD